MNRMTYFILPLLMLLAVEAGAVEGIAVDKQGKPIYTITLPAMMDNHGNEVRTVCEMKMEAAMREMEYFLIWRNVPKDEPENKQWAYVKRKGKMYELLTAAKACWRTP